MVLIRKRKVFVSARLHSAGKRSRKVVFSRQFRGVKAADGEVSDLQHYAKSLPFGKTSTSDSSLTLTCSSAMEETTNEIKPDAESGKLTYVSLKDQRLQDWSDIRDEMYEAFISSEAPSTDTCHECEKKSQLFKCIDCTPWEMVCEDCLERRHQYPHLHMFEAWRVSKQQFLLLEKLMKLLVKF
ncbi:uncharacterized protein LOC127708425 [Mytilus californianus]|uniref:uncharacterized protein LOC127708425 n=1 Tax=Mytilus californianus TaxID=6549 RepID=UPI00224737E4|nr:uncharacterized protein LOC127708425 [Mytilus californianus]